MKKFKFIDLFAGIGGFHQAMVQLGGQCVYASEIDKFCIERYKENYNIDADHDITKINPEEVPDHDVLCGGFPCQAFSKAGKQKGFEETRGTLFFYIEKILQAKKPKYIVLENVRNLVSHDNGNTWKVIRQHIIDCGYRITENPIIISPHQLGIPQLRERVVILGVYDPDNTDKYLNIDLGTMKDKKDNSIESILEPNNNEDKYKISKQEERVLSAWDEFYKMIDLKVIGFPIIVDFFDGHIDPDYPNWKKQFVEKFKLINKNFNEVFVELFGGGKAELILEDESNLLECGIDIRVQPPGKKRQHLSLLSGGERAMTAIVLLFAILNRKKAPFVILDEVEAALDEANVSRFAHYLTTLKKDTQFIVITHRKGTMEESDRLYGVTMQNSGISKLVSVNLKEIDDKKFKELTK